MAANNNSGPAASDRVHIFDVDHTVVRKTSTEYFVQMALKEKVIRFSQINHLLIDWVKYKLAFPDINFIEHTVKKMAGMQKNDLERVSAACFIKRIKPNIYSSAKSLIDEALKNGEKVIFATSSFDFIIKPLEQFFGIEGSLACQFEYSQGKTTGNLVGYSSFGPKKKTAAQAWMGKNAVNPQNVSFYSDSYTDLPLLEYCGNPIAVNPDGILERKAKKRGWKILYFKDVLG
ncbi:MAG: HAD-IB family hydrolase [Spirochaetaceae bacterium]|nr:HAD-IB family hydrolase [Spirochaetaceae bacterium]